MKFLSSFFAILTIIFTIISSVLAALVADTSTLQSVADFQCLKKSGYNRVILRSWFEAYGGHPGGAIDPSFLKSYNNAKAAGFTYIDTYMFPCTGRTTCKTPKQQVDELVQFINVNKIIVQRIWLDVEINPNSNNWGKDSTKNRQVLQQFVDAWKATGWKFGLYVNLASWKSVTGDPNWVLDPSLPLWYPGYDNRPSLNNFKSFGGWKQAAGKQYADSKMDHKCGNFDRSVFSDTN